MMRKAKPATKLTTKALLVRCLNKRSGMVIHQLPPEHFDTLLEIFAEHQANEGKYSMRAIANVVTEAFGVKLTRNMLDGAYAEFKLGKLKKVT